MSYIIKNCDSYNFGCCLSTNGTRLYCHCKDITDCLLKRITDICKAEKGKGFTISRYGVKTPVSDGYDLASEILKLLEIEECE